MSRWEHRYLGQERFPDALSAIEVEHFFTLGEEEFAAVRRRRRVLNRLALALQIGFLKMTGGTLNSVEIIPAGVLEHLGRQLGCAPPRIASIRALYRRRRTLFDHQAAALSALGRTEPSEHGVAARFVQNCTLSGISASSHVSAVSAARWRRALPATRPPLACDATPRRIR
jgi:uncharacterized protein DUF4158